MGGEREGQGYAGWVRDVAVGSFLAAANGHTWYRLGGNNSRSNGSLDGHLELLAWNELLEAGCQRFANLVC